MRLFIAINFNNNTRSRLLSLRDELRSRSERGSFTLPENVDTGNINAQLTDGVLGLVLPKLKNAPEDKAKKIEVK